VLMMTESEIAVSPGSPVFGFGHRSTTGLLLTQAYELWSTRRYYSWLLLYVRYEYI
jgi:hypothetical protein